ncbi:MAG: glycosyltransferase family 2 protein, partial [Candidatus Hydrothermarchaeales archaeon]
AYNEGEAIREVVGQSMAQVDHVIVVDDGSKDDTAKEAKAGGAEVISYTQNMGKAYALKKGFERCSDYDVVVSLDGDLQHGPEEIPKLLKCLEDGSDLCVGSRILSGNDEMPPSRRFSNWVASHIISFLIKQKITDPQSGFRAIKRPKLDLLELKAERYAIEHVMLLEAAKKGLKIGEVPITCKYGDAESDINAFRDTLRVVYYMTRFLVRG